ncbi:MULTISPECIES: phospholipase D-like domain-containing protein [unclassified Ruegeria]|uniref:phospholipase D-like domain-containing protein n=1 Tax=unclassified Ruegeria TaxID=2625375 RepID=UPI0014891F09|nr:MULTISPECIES: phospholipase D-like domain-containing protein [unclassified Ruegeria]
MRVSTKADGFSVQAISGTRVVMLHMNAKEDVLDGFLGFGVGLRTETGGIRWLKGFKCFESVVPDPARAQRFDTADHPVQDFRWGHYWAEPDRAYSYVIRPLYRPVNGDLSTLRPGTDLEITVRTESEEIGEHSIFFNRGAIVSQAYAERFANDETLDQDALKAELDDPHSERTQWLSRGLLEGALNFIAQARDSRFSLHCGFYELTYPPILQALADAAARGARVEVTFEADFFKRSENRRTETKYGVMNRAAIAPFAGQANLHFKERIHFVAITHNKFMVLKENGHPVQVWTGSTNITASGFCGQSNTGHVVRDEGVAQAYSDYFDLLARDAQREEMRAFTEARTPPPQEELPENSITPLFSPRKGSSELDWYGRKIEQARQTVILTSAFGVTTRLAKYFDNDRDYLRYILMEQRSRGAGAQEMIERDRDTRIVFGQGLGFTGSLGHWRKVPGFKLEQWMWREHHFRSSGHVFFVHTKYMGIDVLTDEPMVFTGSANFSPGSLSSNDENMLLIRGNTRVSDVYLTEFFRLLNHFYFRQVANRKARDGHSDPRIRFLDETGDWVRGHFQSDFYRSKRRELFGVAP